MKIKKNIFKLALALALVLTIFLQASSVLFNHILYAEASPDESDDILNDPPPSSENSDNANDPEASINNNENALDIEKLKQITYDALKIGYNISKDDKLPDELLKDYEGTFMTKFNDILAKTLNVKDPKDITVKMAIEDVTELDLSGINMTNVSEIFYYMSSLKNVDLSYNDFAVVDFTDAFLYSLEKVNLSYNPKLQQFNSFDLDALRHLDLSYCDIQTKSVLSINTKLEALNLSGNKIEAFSISNIENLKEINISDGILRFLEIKNCPVIEKIAAKDNKLSAINFEGLASLTHLDLSGNYLTSVPNLTSSAMLSAGEVNFSNNQLISVPDYISALGINASTADFSDNLLDPTIYGDQKKIVIKDDTSVTITKEFNSQEVLEKIKPFIALKASTGEENLQALSPNLGFTMLLDSSEASGTNEISADSSTKLSIKISSQSQPEGLLSDNASVALDVSLKSSGDAGVSVDGKPFELVSPISKEPIKTNIAKPDENGNKEISDSKNNNSEISSSNINDSSKASLSSTNNATTQLPQTGTNNITGLIFLLLAISVIIGIIGLLISRNSKNKA